MFEQLKKTIENIPADTCGLCCSRKKVEHRTLYGVRICDRCHVLLMAHDVKEDIENLEKQVSSLGKTLRHHAPNQVRKQPRYYYFRDGFETYRIPRSVDGCDEEPFSPTGEALRRRSFIDRMVSFIFPKLWKKWFLDRVVQEKIEEELRQSKEQIELRRQGQIKAAEEFLRVKVYKYVERGIKKIYPERYQRIIRKAQKEKILLYEYFIGDYPPDWEHRAQEVRRRDGYQCQDCGVQSVELHVHHKKPVRSFNHSLTWAKRSPLKWTELQRRAKGTHYMDNLATLCRDCHSKKHPHMSRLRKMGDLNDISRAEP